MSKTSPRNPAPSLPDLRSIALRRKAMGVLLGALGVGCGGGERPSGIIDASARDGQGVDIVFAELAPVDVAQPPGDAMDGGLDAALDADGDAGMTGDRFTVDAVFDGPPDDCCADAAVVATRPIAPRSGGYVPSRRPTFRWTAHAGAERYRVELGTSRTFTSPTVMFTSTPGATSLRPDADVAAGRVWWRVVPVSAMGMDLTPSATWSVSIGRVAGDVNGDGFSDVVVGAPEHDFQVRTDSGRVQLFFGGNALDSVADVTLDGTNTGEAFGRSVSVGGDVNGDGFADIAVGAPFAPPNQAGRVLIYLGGASVANAPAVTIAGAEPSAQFGRNVSIVGDLNGDGFDDVLVSTPFHRGTSGVNAGRAWVYLGGATMDAVADVELTYTSAGDQLGFSSGAAGDVNGDGFMDVIVGAPRNGNAGADSGAGYVWWGGAPMDTGVDVIVLGLAPGSRAGDTVSTLGDLNNDGYADYALGAVGASVGGPNSGAVLGFSGHVGVIPRPMFAIQGTGPERLGTALAGGEDLDGDGFDDLVLGARDNSTAGALSGRAYAYRGTATGVPLLAATYGNSSGMMGGGDEFGGAVSIVGDANGDGFADVVVGAPNAPFMGTSGPGRAYLFVGGTTLVPSAQQTYAPAAPSAFGFTIARR